MSERAVAQVIDAVVAGQPIDWNHAETRYPHQALLLRQLRAISDLATLAPCAAHAEGATGGVSRSNWMRVAGGVVIGLAAAQVIAGAFGYVAGFVRPSAVPPVAYFVALVVFGAASVWLFVGARDDPRANALGAFLLLVAASFAPRFIQSPSPAASVFRGLYPESFAAAFLWRFIRQFPRTVHYSRTDVFCARAERIAAVAGGLLFIINLLGEYGVPLVPHVFARADRNGMVWYSSVLFSLLAPAPIAVVLRGRHAAPAERRRLAVFSLGFGFVLMAVAAEIIAELAVPSFRAYTTANRAAATPYFFGILLLLPITTAYAVVVDSVLDVQITISRVARYLLARHMALALTCIPFVGLAWHFYANRQSTVAELSAGWTGIAAIAAFLFGMILTVTREPALAFLDAHFHRRAVDLATETAAFAAHIGNARSIVEVADVLEREVGRVLAVEHVVTYAIAPTGATYEPIHRSGRSLPTQSALAAILTADRTPIILDEFLRPLLPADELRWRDDTGTAVLVPIVAIGDRTVGFLAVSPKLSGDTFTRADRAFLGTMASAAALRLDALDQPAAGTMAASRDDEPAAECKACRRVVRARQPLCECGGSTRPAAVPFFLSDKFQALSYVGAGGMGVVYEALDVTLTRHVALKTLGRLSGAAADRLAAEARMMAAVAHPNLATIYGVERWRRTPVLVLEFFERGTLGRRLVGPQPIDEVLRLGVLLAPALEQLHQSGILHRDIKPNNIGFTRDDVPKLLDFGLASFLSADGAQSTSARQGRDAEAGTETQTLSVVGGDRLAGTPLYLPPEAIEGAAPSESFDLWALSLVLFEAIAGRHPFASHTVPEVLSKISRMKSLNLVRCRPDCPPTVALAFARMLSRHPRDRPPTAAALRSILTRLV